MNRQQYIQQGRILQRKYEEKYFPKLVTAIQSKIDEVIAVVNANGIQSAISFLNKEVSNTKVTEIVQAMTLDIGLRFASRQWQELQIQKRGAKRPLKEFVAGVIKSVRPYIVGEHCPELFIPESKSFVHHTEAKAGFGFNAEWVSWIKNYLFNFIVEKISFSVFQTTKDTVFKVLNEAIAQGWGMAETVKELNDLDISKVQAARIARTEITRAANAGAMAAGSTFEYQQQKEWISAHDKRVRGLKPGDHASHIGLDGTIIDYEDVFYDPINGDELMFPGDPKASAASTINCRCSVAVFAKLDDNGRLIPKRRFTSVIYPSRRRQILITV